MSIKGANKNTLFLTVFLILIVLTALIVLTIVKLTIDAQHAKQWGIQLVAPEETEEVKEITSQEEEQGVSDTEDLTIEEMGEAEKKEEEERSNRDDEDDNRDREDDDDEDDEEQDDQEQGDEEIPQETQQETQEPSETGNGTESTEEETGESWENSFEESDWQEEWNIPDDKAFGEQNLVIVENDDGTDTYLRVTYPEGSFSPSATRDAGIAEGGAQFLGKPEDIVPAEELRLQYKVLFPEDFDFVKGGKLPGLYGGTEISGGDMPDGTNGHSERLMWREDGAGEVYFYGPDNAGTSIGRGNWYFQPGQWHTIDLRVGLNDVGQSNGYIILYVDGKEVIDEDDIIFRTVDDLQIDGIFFSTFFGGGDASWATPQTTYTYFNDFELEKI